MCLKLCTKQPLKISILWLRLDYILAIAFLHFAFFFFFFGGPTPLTLFMEHEQCIKAKLQYLTVFSVVNSNPKIIFFMFSAISFQFSVK